MPYFSGMIMVCNDVQSGLLNEYQVPMEHKELCIWIVEGEELWELPAIRLADMLLK